MPSTDPDDTPRPAPATANDVTGSSIGSSVQAQTIFGGVRVQQFTLDAKNLVRAGCVVAMIAVAGLFWLPVGRPKPADQAQQPAPAAPGIALLKVNHAFNQQFDHVALFLHNPAAASVPVTEISLYLAFDAKNWWHDPDDRQESHFEVGKEMFLGPANHDGVTRLHGTVRTGANRFDLPLVGQGFVAANGSWRRLLTFSPQLVVPAGETTEVTIDIPVTFPVKKAVTPGKLTEMRFDPTTGSLFTHALVRSPNSAAHACDFVKKTPDPALCDTVDPPAAVAAPR